jgi:hypothetical protein
MTHGSTALNLFHFTHGRDVCQRPCIPHLSFLQHRSPFIFYLNFFLFSLGTVKPFLPSVYAPRKTLIRLVSCFVTVANACCGVPVPFTSLASLAPPFHLRSLCSNFCFSFCTAAAEFIWWKKKGETINHPIGPAQT